MVNLRKDSFEQRAAQLIVELDREAMEADLKVRWAMWLLCHLWHGIERPYVKASVVEEWENDLMGYETGPENPHWACDTPTSPPCPTGEHNHA